MNGNEYKECSNSGKIMSLGSFPCYLSPNSELQHYLAAVLPSAEA